MAMELILWRHAEAEDPSGGGDMTRALTRRGRKQAERIAHWLRPRLAGDWLLLASPAKRTLQTVKALDLPFEERDGLGPGAGAQALLSEAGWPDAGRNVLLVGHQPTLGEVAARLLGAGEGLAVRKGAIWWFAARGRDEAVLRAVLDPELAEGRP